MIEGKGVEPKQPFMSWHWQNLNERGERRRGWLAGRCWFNFRKATVRAEWEVGTLRFLFGVDIRDEYCTLSICVPLISLHFGISSYWPPLYSILPKYRLETHPDLELIEEREMRVAIHDWTLWVNPYSHWGETRSKDPWWVRGFSVDFHPFRWKHQAHEVRYTAEDGVTHLWEPYADSPIGDVGDRREVSTHPYVYRLRNGEVQNRLATIFVERRKWRPRSLRWTSLFERVVTVIDVRFNAEVGERTGSWKGGTIGCSWAILPGETPEAALRRMEKERVFD